MTEQELQAIEERAAQATPGPWTPDIESDRGYRGDDFGRWFCPTFKEAPFSKMCCEEGKDEQAEKDAAFIAAARSDVPALIAEIRRFRTFARRLVACYDGESSDLFALVREVRAALGEGE